MPAAGSAGRRDRGRESRMARRGVACGPSSGRLRRPTVDVPAVRRPCNKGHPSSTKRSLNLRALCLFSRAVSERRPTPAFESRLPAACPFGCVAAHSRSLACSPQYISCARERVTVAPARRGRTRIGALRRGDADAAYGVAGERSVRRATGSGRRSGGDGAGGAGGLGRLRFSDSGSGHAGPGSPRRAGPLAGLGRAQVLRCAAAAGCASQQCGPGGRPQTAS